MKKILLTVLLPLMLLLSISIGNNLKAQTQSVDIGTGSAVSNRVPFNTSNMYAFTQVVYSHHEVGSAGYIGRIVLQNKSTESITIDELTIYMAHVFDTVLTSLSWAPQDSLVQVFHATDYTIPKGEGPIVITLDTSFHYDGIHHLAIVTSRSDNEKNWRSSCVVSPISYNGAMWRGSDTDGSDAGYPTSPGRLEKRRPNISLIKSPTTTFCFPISSVTVQSYLDDNIVISWAPEGQNSNYEVAILDTATAGTNMNTATPISVTTTTHTFTNLAPNSVYKVGVRHVCSASEKSDWKTTMVRTTVVPNVLPFTCDFESESARESFALDNSICENYWVIDTVAHCGENSSYGLYITDVVNGVKNHNYNKNSSKGSFVIAKCLVDIPERGDYNIGYDWVCEGENSSDYLRVALIPVMDMENIEANIRVPVGFSSTKLPENMIAADGGAKLNLKTTWQNYKNVITVPAAGGYYLAFIWANDPAVCNNPPAAIDNVNMERATCQGVDSVVVNNITTTSVDINGYSLSGNHFKLYYKEYDADKYDTLDINTPYTLDNLRPGTFYQGILRSSCIGGDSYALKEFTFGTEYPVMSLPWFFGSECSWISKEDEDANYPYGWVNINGEQTYNKWQQEKSEIYSGNKSIKFPGSSNVNSKHDDWLITPKITFRGNEEMNFWVKSSGNNSAPSYIARFALYASTDSITSIIDTAHYIPLAITGTNVSDNYIEFNGSQWLHLSVQLPATLVGNRHLAFVIRNNSYTFFLDDISIYEKSTCPIPSDVKISSLSSTEAIVECTHDASSFTAYYGAPGFNIDTAESVVSDTTVINLSNLNSSSTYEVIILANCQEGSVSGPSFPVKFTTPCAPFATTALPIFEDFSDNQCGKDFPLDECWIKGSNSSIPYPYVDKDKGYLTPHSLRMNASSRYYSYVALPSVETDLSNLTISGIVMSSNTSIPLQLGLMSNPYDTSSFRLIKKIEVPEINAWTDFQISLEGLESELEDHLAFMVPSSNNVDIYLDNILLIERGTCNAPMHLVFNTVSSNSATVSWTDTVGTAWTIYYGEPGFDLSTADSLVVTTKSAIIPNLAPSTTYEFFVKSNCEDASKSIPSMRCQFTTTCIPISQLPYTDNFESYGTGKDASLNPCWISQTVGSPNSCVYPSDEAGINSTRGLYLKSFVSGRTSGIGYVALPEFQESLINLRIQFNMKHLVPSGWGTKYSEVAVGVMTNPYDISTFEDIKIIDMTDEADDTIIFQEVSFASYTGMGHYIALKAIDDDKYSGNKTNHVYIDDVVVSELPNCRIPINVTMTAKTSTSIELTWVGNASSYEVMYSTHADMSDSTVVTFSNDSCQVTGLNPYTYYYIKVRGICDNALISEWTPEYIVVQTEMDCGEGFSHLTHTIGDGSNTTNKAIALNGDAAQTQTMTWTIFTDEELESMGLLSTNNKIKSISLQSATVGTPISFKVYMAETTTEEFTSTTPDTLTASQMTLVYDGTMTFRSNTWNEIILNTPFTYSDTANLMIAFERSDTLTSSTAFRYGNQSLNRTYTRFLTERGIGTARTLGRANMIFHVCADIPSCVRPLKLKVSNVLDNAISLSWKGSAANYEIAYDMVDFNPDSNGSQQTIQVAGVTTSNMQSATITSIVPHQTYYIYVRGVCGENDKSFWASTSASTPCTAISLPYSENFDSYSAGVFPHEGQVINPCWVKNTSETIPYPYLTHNHVASPANSLVFGGRSYAALPLFTESLANTVLTFKLYSETSSSISVGVMTNPYDITSFHTIASMSPSVENEWEQFEVNFSSYNGMGKCIAFRTSTTSNNTCYLDDVEVFVTPSCQSPSHVQVTAIGTDSAIVSWTDRETGVNGYEIEYGPKGFVLGEGIRIQTTTNPTVLRNLLVGTSYDVYVHAICAGNESGQWSFKKSFNTQCGPMALPLIYDFENAMAGEDAPLPNCFYRYNDASSPAVQCYPYVNISAANSTNAHSGSHYLYYEITSFSTAATTQAMVFPEIDTVNYPMSGNQIVFWGKCTSAITKLIVGIMKDVDRLNTFTVVDTVTLTSTYTQYSVPFTNYTGNGTHPVIMVTRGNDRYYAYIDDVIIEETPSCPRVYDLHAISTTDTSATLAWTDTIYSSQWMVDYREAGSSTIQSVSTTTNPCVIRNLRASTKYFFNVRPICESGDTSSNVYTDASFWTSQHPATIPYNYDFEDVTEWNNWQTNSNCDINWNRGNAIASQGTYAMYLSTDNGTTNSTNWQSVVNTVAYRDIDFGSDTSSFDMTFKVRAGGAINELYDGVTVALVNPMEDIQSTNDNFMTPWGHVRDIALTTVHRDSAWITYHAYFENVTGIHRMVFSWSNATMRESDSYMNQPGAIDEIMIQEQTCARPDSLHVTDLESSSATLNWHGNTDEYEISYRIANADRSTAIRQVVQYNIANIRNLASSTTYEYSVRAICSVGDTSGWSNPAYFTTICARYVACDTIREDFTNVEGEEYDTHGILPDCWEGYATGLLNIIPHVVDSGFHWYAHNEKALAMTSGNIDFGHYTVVRMPYTEEPVNTLTLKYWMATSSSTVGYLEVGYLTGAQLSNDFVAIKTIPSTEETYCNAVGTQLGFNGLYDTVSFENAPADAKAIAFRWVSTDVVTTVCLDDIVLSSNATCKIPTNVDATVDHANVSLTWEGLANNYQVRYKEMNTLDWIDTIDVTGENYTLTNLLPHTDYMAQVRAICGENNASIWSEVYFTTDEMLCAVPVVTVSDISGEKATFNWNEGENNTSWEVHVFNTIMDTTVSVNTTSFTITGLEHATAYKVAVRSQCTETVYSDWSDTVQFTTLDCAPVTGVAASDITKNSAVIKWTAGANETSWEINYGEADFSQGNGQVQTVTTTTYTITNLEPETSYDVYVRAICGEDFYSIWSTPVCRFSTLADEQEGIDGVESNIQFAIYPNPTSGETTISLNGVEGKVVISVVDMNGRTVANETIECGVDCQKRIDVNNLSQGTYFVRVLGNNVNSVRKLIVR